MPLEHEWMCACLLSRFSRVRLFLTLWTIAHQAPLSMGFSSQEYWSGLPGPPLGDLPDTGIDLPFLQLLHCRRILYHWATGEENTVMHVINTFTDISALIAKFLWNIFHNIYSLWKFVFSFVCILVYQKPFKLNRQEMITHSTILPGNSCAHRSLSGCSSQGRKELDMTDMT